MDYDELIDAHVDRRADITIAAQPVTLDDATAMGIFRFDRDGQIVAFEEKPTRDAARGDRPEHPAGRASSPATRRTSRSSPRWASTCSRGTCCSRCWRATGPNDFGREIIPAALERYRVQAHLFRGYWADVGTVDVVLRREHHAHAPQTRRSSSTIRRRPIYTHPRFLPGSRLSDCTFATSIVAEGCHLDRCASRGLRRRHPDARPGGRAIRRSVLLGADFYEADDEAPARGDDPRLGIGRDVVLDRVIVDKNARIGDGARLVNEAGVERRRRRRLLHPQRRHLVPKDGVVLPGTTV